MTKQEAFDHVREAVRSGASWPDVQAFLSKLPDDDFKYVIEQVMKRCGYSVPRIDLG